jgi:hypothetical protein
MAAPFGNGFDVIEIHAVGYDGLGHLEDSPNLRCSVRVYHGVVVARLRSLT